MAKVKVKFGDFKNLKKFVRNAAKKDMPNKIEDIVLERISKGISPVLGQGRFKPYSDSYKKQIRKGRYRGKSIRPVNLYLTGEMIKTFFVNPKGNGFRIGFTSDLADVHNRLGPRGKREFIRRLLPTIPGEQFTKSIIKDIINELKGILRKTKKRAKA